MSNTASCDSMVGRLVDKLFPYISGSRRFCQTIQLEEPRVNLKLSEILKQLRLTTSLA